MNDIKYFKAFLTVVVTLTGLWWGCENYMTRYARAKDLDILQLQTIKSFDELNKRLKRSDLERQHQFLIEQNIY